MPIDHPLYLKGERIHQELTGYALEVFAADLNPEDHLNMLGMAYDLAHDANEVIRALDREV